MTENGTRNNCKWDRCLKHTRENGKKVERTLNGKKWQEMTKCHHETKWQKMTNNGTEMIQDMIDTDVILR